MKKNFITSAALAFGLLWAAPAQKAEAQGVGGYTSISAGTGSNNVAIPASKQNFPFVLMVPSIGTTQEVFYELGDATVVAVINTKTVPPGGICIPAGAATYVAAITATGSTNLRITQLSSCPLFSGNGGGGGGGGGAVASVFGRTGSVLAQSGDYNFNQLAGNYTLAQGPTIGANTVLGSIAGGTPAALTQAQLTALVSLSNSGAGGSIPAIPNNTTMFLRGDNSFATLNCAALTNSGAFCSGTSAASLSGTMAAAQLPAFGSGDVSFASGGGAGTIAANAVTLAKLATQGANTILGNATPGATVPTALSIGSCSTSASAIIWTSSSGFGCNTAIAAPVGSLTGAGAGVVAAAAINIGSAGAFVTFNGAGGVPSAINLTNGTALPCTTGIASIVSAVCTWMLTPSSANLAAAVTDETGTGPLVFRDSPAFTTTIGVTSNTNGVSRVITARNSNAGSSAFTITDWGNDVSTSAGEMLVTSSTNTQYGGINSMNFLTNSGSIGFFPGNVTAITADISGHVFLPSIQSDAAASDSTMCSRGSNGEVLKGSGTLGVCLGTSSERYKDNIVDMTDGLSAILALRPKNFWYKKGYGDGGLHEQYGFIAEQAVSILPKLTHYNEEGLPNSFDMLGIVPILVQAIQELKAELDAAKETGSVP